MEMRLWVLLYDFELNDILKLCFFGQILSKIWCYHNSHLDCASFPPSHWLHLFLQLADH